ncbi:MAG: hypothetical protein ACI82Q_001810 [Nonlabens sp.]|jgi:hypothetical protein
MRWTGVSLRFVEINRVSFQELIVNYPNTKTMKSQFLVSALLIFTISSCNDSATPTLNEELPKLLKMETEYHSFQGKQFPVRFRTSYFEYKNDLLTRRQGDQIFSEYFYSNDTLTHEVLTFENGIKSYTNYQMKNGILEVHEGLNLNSTNYIRDYVFLSDGTVRINFAAPKDYYHICTFQNGNLILEERFNNTNDEYLGETRFILSEALNPLKGFSGIFSMQNKNIVSDFEHLNFENYPELEAADFKFVDEYELREDVYPAKRDIFHISENGESEKYQTIWYTYDR